MFIIDKKHIFLRLSGILIVLSIAVILVLGVNPGIDFVGGTLAEVEYSPVRPDTDIVREKVAALSLGETIIQPTGERGLIVKTRDLSEEEHTLLINALSIDGKENLEEKRFTSIGPVIGQELQRKAVVAIALVIALIILFIAYVFRKVSHPVSSWKYGIVAVVALAHDILIPTALFVVFGKITGAEVDALFVTALLAILGLSVNDTIVVFDRIRENLTLKVAKTFSETVGVSLRQTITRSVNTSFTTLLVLVVLAFLGPEPTRNFAIVLSVGMIAGTYSSIFFASPLLVLIEERQRRRRK